MFWTFKLIFGEYILAFVLATFSNIWPIFFQSSGHRGQGIKQTAYWPILPVQAAGNSCVSGFCHGTALFKNVKIVGISTFTLTQRHLVVKTLIYI